MAFIGSTVETKNSTPDKNCVAGLDFSRATSSKHSVLGPNCGPNKLGQF